MPFQLSIFWKVYLPLLSIGFEISRSHCPSDFMKTDNVCTRAYSGQEETARDAVEICGLVAPSGKLVIVDNDFLAELSYSNSSLSLTENHVYFIGPYPTSGNFCHAIQYNHTQAAWQVGGIACNSVIHFICQTDISYESPAGINASSVQYQFSSFDVTVQWQEPSLGNFTGFQLVANDTFGTMLTLDLDDVTTNTTFTGLCGGREYTFYLYVVNGNMLSQPVSFTEFTDPTPVKCVNVTHSKNHVTFTWYPVEGAVTFYEAFLLEVDKMKLKSEEVFSGGLDVMELRISKGKINSKRHDLIIETVLDLELEEKKSIFQLPLNPDDTLIEESFCNFSTPSSTSSPTSCRTTSPPTETTKLSQQSSTAAPNCSFVEEYLTMPDQTSRYLSTPKNTPPTSSSTHEGTTSSESFVSTSTELFTNSPSTEEHTSPTGTRTFETSSTNAYETSTFTNMATEDGFLVRNTSETSEPRHSSTGHLPRTPTPEDDEGVKVFDENSKTELSTKLGELPESTNRDSTSVEMSYTSTSGASFESSSPDKTTVEGSLRLLSTWQNVPAINTSITPGLRTTQEQTTTTHQATGSSESLSDSYSMTSRTVMSQNRTTKMPEDENPFVNCSFSSQFDSSSENLTTVATRFIQSVLAGILSLNNGGDCCSTLGRYSLTTESDFTSAEDDLNNCSLPEESEGVLSVDVLAGYITDELLQLTSDDVTIEIDDQPGVKDFKLIVNPSTTLQEEGENLQVEFESGIEIEVPFSTFNRSDCCKAILLYEEDEDSWSYPSFDNYCSDNGSQMCSLVPRPFNIATISVYPPPPVDLFSEPIELEFRRQQSVTTDLQANSNLVPTCAWLDEELSTESRLVWKTENITTFRHPDNEQSTESVSEVIKCLSYHLTSFSVIMRPAELQLEDNHHRALTIISMVGSIITILSAIITVGVFIFLGLLQNQRIVHSNLISAVALSHLVFIVGIDKVQNKVFCSLVSVFLFYLLSASFCWMLMEATYLYVSVVQVFASELKVLKYTLIGWGLPLCIVGVTVATSFKQLISDFYCWLPVKGNKILAFIVPSFVIIVANLLLLFAVLYEINKMVDRNIADVKISRTRTTAKALLLMLPLIGTPWIFALFALNSDLIIFDYLFNIFNSFQGLWIFLMHIVGNKEVRTRLRAKVNPQPSRNDWVTQTTKSEAPSESLPMAKISSL